LSRNYYHNGDKSWDAPTLIQYAKEENYRPFDLPIAGIDLSAWPFTIENIWDLVWHVNRCKEADLSYPILLSNKGYIMDGWHRVMKAIVEKQTYIKALRFDSMPDSSD
jgi:hypothetical protein